MHILATVTKGALLRQGMQDLNKAAPQAAGGEADPETQQAVQRVFNLVRNGASGNGNGAKDCDLTLDDVVRFYNVSCRSVPPPSLHNSSSLIKHSLHRGLRCKSDLEGICLGSPLHHDHHCILEPAVRRR